MINRIKALVTGGAVAPAPAGHHGTDELQLAAAVLLVEAAHLDHTFDAAEREAIRRLLAGHFALAPAEVDALITAAESAADDAVELSRFVRRIKDAYDHDERIEILEMLWEVVYADAVLHDYEANMLRRVAGLLYVSDRDSGAARKRVIGRLAADAANPPA